MFEHIKIDPATFIRLEFFPGSDSTAGLTIGIVATLILLIPSLSMASRIAPFGGWQLGQRISDTDSWLWRKLAPQNEGQAPTSVRVWHLAVGIALLWLFLSFVWWSGLNGPRTVSQPRVQPLVVVDREFLWCRNQGRPQIDRIAWRHIDAIVMTTRRIQRKTKDIYVPIMQIEISYENPHAFNKRFTYPVPCELEDLSEAEQARAFQTAHKVWQTFRHTR